MVIQKRNANIQNLIYGYEKISSAYSSSPVDTLFFIQKVYVALISQKFCLFTKACSHFSKENTETILVSQVIQNYVGLSSALRIRRSKSLAFAGRPTISVILTLGSCDVQRQIMVIPLTFRHSDTIVSDGTQRQIMVILRPFCHPEAAGPMTCGDKLWSFRTLFRHSYTVVSDGTQRIEISVNGLKFFYQFNQKN